MDHKAACDELRSSPAYSLVNGLINLLLALRPRRKQPATQPQTA